MEFLAYQIYDVIIGIGLVSSFLLGGVLLRALLMKHSFVSGRIARPSFFIAMIVSFLAGIILIWGSFIEPRLIVSQHEELDLPNVESPITIAFVADYQVGPYKKADFIEKSIDVILKGEPDVVLIGGDHVFNAQKEMLEDETQYLEPFRRLAEEVPTYAIHGNHEYGVWAEYVVGEPERHFYQYAPRVKEVMEKLGVRYLVNGLELLNIRGEELYVYGTDAWWSENLSFEGLNEREVGIDTIVLNHNPAASWEASEYDVDLILNGHTHGGQIRLPFIGPLARVDSVIPKEWYKGFYEVNGLRGYTTGGIGESGTRARLFNVPEVVFFHVY